MFGEKEFWFPVEDMTSGNKEYLWGAMSIELIDDQAGSYKFKAKSDETHLRGKFQKYLEQSKSHLKTSRASQGNNSNYSHIVCH